MNAASIPEQREGNRDSAATAPPTPWMPPYGTALDALRALETVFGTRPLADAISALRYDPAFQARALHDELDDLRALAAGTSLAADLEPGFAMVAAATPYPGRTA